MLHLVEADCPASEDDVLRAMFAARKDVFVDLLGWDCLLYTSPSPRD